MSNQFYNYISQVLLEYFKESGVKAGDRFYLQLDRAEDVQKLVESLKEQGSAKEFTYKHDLGDQYRTFCIEVRDIRLVVAYTSETVRPDFLVTLRNQVGEQKGVWHGTALLSIVSEQLDSIQGGSSDLQKEGMPLHPASIVKKLKHDIENGSVDKVDEIILLDSMETLLQEQSYQQITFFEFEDIFSVLAKGSIENKDYKTFGLFKDEDLATFTGNKLRERLNLNKELYDYVRKIHDFGLEMEELDKKFSPTGASRLKKEDWAETSFSDVHRFYQEYMDMMKKAKIDLKELTIKGGVKHWDRPQKESSVGLRKRHLIIFNPEHQEEIHINAAFSIIGGNVKSLSEQYGTVSAFPKDSATLKVKRTNIEVTLATKDKVTFAKVAYKHDKKAALGAELFITVLPIEPYVLDNYKSRYLVNPSKKRLELQYEGNELVFGQGYTKKTMEVIQYAEQFTLDTDDQLILIPQPDAFNDEGELEIHIQLAESNATLPIFLKNELPESTPISGLRIWKMKREQQQDFEWQNNRLLFGNREFYLNPDYKQMFEWEKAWVEAGMEYAVADADTLIQKDIQLSKELREAYNAFVGYFQSKQSIPSLCYYTPQLKEIAAAYLQAYIHEVNSFNESQEAGRRGRDLFKLGTVAGEGIGYFTPFHPMVVAFQLQMQASLGNEEVDNSIVYRLRPNSLVPYIYHDNDVLYRPDNQNTALEWIVFRPVNQVSVSDANQYLAKVIEDKLLQFEEHFGYLFSRYSKAPIQINVINIENDYEVVRGLLKWMLNKIDEGVENLKAVEVTLYKENNAESFFDVFSRIDAVGQIEDKFNVKLSTSQYESQDVIRFIREKLFYYKQSMNSEYKYAHISFYKMNAQEHDALQPMEDMISGVALEGLYSSVSSVRSSENYRTGFGIKHYSVEDNNLLLQTTYYFNELSANLRNGGNDTYRKGIAICSRTTTADEKTLDAIFQSSYWVTFVDPTIGLEFFHSYGKNVVIIHYSDQYSSSSRYDAITVTDKSQQYYAVIREFLASKEVESSDDNVKQTVKAFNTFNGEWLLRIIGSKGHYSREKLSIISAIKFSLAYFDHPDILWVPISLEEILRVAGAVSLNKSEGIFTTKNLGRKGSHSDDVLLIGLENKHGKLMMHFYPVEVKIGINKNDVLEKAKTQVRQTKKLIQETLTNEEDKKFTSRFYRNFFTQLYIANAKKFAQSGIWTEKDYALSGEVIEKLLKDQFTIGSSLEESVGKGAVLSFQRDAYHRSSVLEDDITFLNLTEEDGYNGLVKPMDEMREWIQEKETDFVREHLLSYKYKTNSVSVIDEKPEIIEPPISSDPELTDIEKSRILIGRAENSNKEIFWEYGNKGLANRHLLISGKSGQGKTYFMQCVLLEKAKQGISSIVIDYTEGFLPNQLEPEFVAYMGDRIKHKIVYSEQLPINPFQKNTRDIGGITLPESDTDVAERIKSVFAAVYKSLGIQQLNAIYDAVLNGLQVYGANMSLMNMREKLEEDGSTYAKTALSQIRPFIDRNPFRHENTMDWNEVVNNKGEVFIIQLTGYPRDVQLMITEFILWDLWNYSVRFGSKHKPMPVIMDEAQNLDHTKESPSARILMEGRKFGWSAWYATQFLKSQLQADELARLQNASEKIYFSPPEQEVSNIAASLSNDPAEKKKWEQRLATLRKGQCIVQGPILMANGELSKPTATVVDIMPLSERL